MNAEHEQQLHAIVIGCVVVLLAIVIVSQLLRLLRYLIALGAGAYVSVQWQDRATTLLIEWTGRPVTKEEAFVATLVASWIVTTALLEAIRGSLGASRAGSGGIDELL